MRFIHGIIGRFIDYSRCQGKGVATSRYIIIIRIDLRGFIVHHVDVYHRLHNNSILEIRVIIGTHVGLIHHAIDTHIYFTRFIYRWLTGYSLYVPHCCTYHRVTGVGSGWGNIRLLLIIWICLWFSFITTPFLQVFPVLIVPLNHYIEIATKYTQEQGLYNKARACLYISINDENMLRSKGGKGKDPVSC